MGRTRLGALAVALCLAGAAHAQPSEEGWRLKTDLALRAIPVGINAIIDAGYRVPLSSSENLLLRKTYVDAGLTTGLSPAYLWAGAYVEALPVAVLQLRLSAQTMQFFGAFGHLLQPTEPGDDGWSLDVIRDQAISDGKVKGGLMLEGRVTPRIKVGNFVAFAEVRFLRFEIDDLEGDWYEPYYDILVAPKDNVLVARPTAGYLLLAEDPKRTYLLVGARFERTLTQETEITRDLLAALALWKIPSDWWSAGDPKLAVLAGAWTQHPNRTEPYIAAQLTLEYGAQ
ncbi:MAG: hypothetical protein H6704_26295 [Myxococcales bacterium]|nr:hypothetical protein [Myxococcales bacterium]MCB9539738.1 hypothetical protein [Myxococcales bacterium]